MCCLTEMGKRSRKLPSDYTRELDSLYAGNVIPLEDYVTNSTPIRHKNVETGIAFTATPTTVLAGESLGLGKRSKGETAIARWLEQAEIRFTTQYILKDCRSPRGFPYRFDFAIFKEDGSLVALIEFDGRQHFEAIPFWGGAAGLAYRKQCDQDKSNYCAENRIPLLRITHAEYFRINSILDHELRGLLGK